MRTVLHVDMDAFYASVEQRDCPALRGRPVMVGGSSARGVVAAASYEARQFGVRSAMPAARARRLCPLGVFLPARFERYREVSSEIFAIFHEVTDQVEGLSLDEAFLEVTEGVETPERALELARAVKAEIARRTGLTASVGVAANKLLAKLASDYDKPDGLVWVPPERVRSFLDPLPVRRLPGIGARGAERLNDAGIRTVGQLRQTAPDVLMQMFGRHGLELAERARGIDERPLSPGRTRRSISQETTLPEDVHELDGLRPIIEKQALKVAERLAARALFARTVTVKLRSTGFSTITRSHSLGGYTRSADRISNQAWELLRQWSAWRSGFSIRLVGVGVSGLSSSPDLDERLD